jgi:serine protease AprX
MAAPIVAGAAALLLQKNPALTPDQVKARLMKTATKTFPATSTNIDPLTGAALTVTYDLFTVGAGYLDIPAALNNTDLSGGPATSPRAVYDASDGSTSVLIEPGSVWDNAVIWGTAVVWGTNVVINGDAVVWGTAVIWGTDTSGGFAVIWGTNNLWGNTQAFPEAVSIHGER